MNGNYEFGKVETMPQHIHDLIVEEEPQKVVLEICGGAGRVVDIAKVLGKQVQVANTMYEGWHWDTSHGVWTWDDFTSPCIDAGNPGSTLSSEPLSVTPYPDNEWGRNLRINMGAFDGTAEASMPPYDWALLADLNNDGIVNLKDYSGQFINRLKNTDAQPRDLDRNGIVNRTDITLLVQDWLEQTSWYTP